MGQGEDDSWGWRSTRLKITAGHFVEIAEVLSVFQQIDVR